MSPSERSRLAHRAVAIQRKLVWMGRNYILLQGEDNSGVHAALHDELMDIQRRLAADQPSSVIPFRKRA